MENGGPTVSGLTNTKYENPITLSWTLSRDVYYTINEGTRYCADQEIKCSCSIGNTIIYGVKNNVGDTDSVNFISKVSTKIDTKCHDNQFYPGESHPSSWDISGNQIGCWCVDGGSWYDFWENTEPDKCQFKNNCYGTIYDRVGGVNRQAYYRIAFDQDSGKLNAYTDLVYKQQTFTPYCGYYWGSNKLAKPVKIQVDCNEDPSCTTSDMPEFTYPPANNTQTSMDYAIDGGNAKFWFDQVTAQTCGKRCKAYFYYEIYTDTTNNIIHPNVTSYKYLNYQGGGADYVYINYNQDLKDQTLQFSIKITSYNDGFIWYSQGGTDVFTIRNYCGPLSARVNINVTNPIQYVDKNIVGSTFYTLPNLGTTVSSCSIIGVTANDQNTVNTTLSTLIAQPVYDSVLKNYIAAPLIINKDQDYVFFSYVLLRGDPTGNFNWTSEQKLYVGCTDSITLTQDARFVQNLNVDCLSAEIGAYTFFAPTVNNRSSYCAQESHTIINIIDNLASSIDAVAFTSTCQPTLLDPYSCGSINLKSTFSPHIVTFQIETKVRGLTTPYISPLITLNIDCRSVANSKITSSIASEIILVQVSVPHVYTFSSTAFNCNCPSTFCSGYTYSVVTDPTGNTVHALILAPVYNVGQNTWDITINLSNVYEYLEFHIMATSMQGVKVVSELIKVKSECGPLSATITVTESAVVQYVDKRDSGTPLTFYTLPALTSSITDCFVEIVEVYDQNAVKTTYSTGMAQPSWDAGSSSWRAVPIDISKDGEYKFYSYVELHGNPNGYGTWTNLMKLVVGCTGTLTLTNSGSFLSPFNMNCRDSVSTYTFYEPTVDIRTYCDIQSHIITDILVDGVPTPGAVYFTSPCSPSILDPSCSSITVESNLTSYEHVITFYIETTVIMRPLPHISNKIILDITCRDPSHAFLTSWIVAPSSPTQYLQFYGYAYGFNATAFSCNCPKAVYCAGITYTTVSEPPGLLPHPVFNSTSNQWEIAIHFQKEQFINFTIMAQTGAGVSVTSEKIMIEIIDNCLFDNITLNTIGGLDKFVSYKSIGGYPIIKVQDDLQMHQDGSSITINMTKRFLHTADDKYCGFSAMQIDKVVDYTANQEIKNYDTLFKISSTKGTNDTIKLSIIEFKAVINYHVFLSIWNGQKWSAGKLNNATAYGYLLDVRLYNQDPYVPVMKPIFKETLESSWQIDLGKLKEPKILEFVIPEGISFMDETLVISIKISGVPSIATFNSDTRTISIDSSKVTSSDIQSSKLKINLDDGQGQTIDFDFEIVIKNTTISAPSAGGSTFVFQNVEKIEMKEAPEIIKEISYLNATITEITSIGLMKLEFSDFLVEFNISLLNSTFLDLYIQPALGRNLDESFVLSTVNFTWSCTKLVNNKMEFKLTFPNPYEISPLSDQDKFIFYIKEEGYPIFRSRDGKDLLPSNVLMIKKIPKQMPDTDFTKQFMSSVNSANKQLKIMLLVTFLMNLVLSGSLRYMIMMIRFLQIVLHLPLLCISIPSNVIALNKVLIQVAMFDLLSSDWTTDLLLKYKGDTQEEFQADTLDQAQDIGYETHYSLKNLGSLGIFLALYFVKLLLFLIVNGLSKLKYLPSWERGKKFLESQKKGLFYADLLVIVIDGFFEFGISLYLQARYDTKNLFKYKPDSLQRLLQDAEEADGLLNFKPVDSQIYLGDTLSKFYAILLFACIFIVLPYTFYQVQCKDFELVKSDEHQQKFGPLYEDLSLKKQSNLSFFPMFCLRRLAIILIVYVLVSKLPSIQLILVLWINIIMLIHTGLTQPFETRLQNRVILMNEFGIGIISYHLFFFTDWVKDQAVKSMYGWSMIVCISLFTGANLMLVLYFGGRGIILLSKKYFNMIEVKTKPMLERYRTYAAQVEEDEIEVIELPVEMPMPTRTLDDLIALNRKQLTSPVKMSIKQLVSKGARGLGPMEFSVVKEVTEDEVEQVPQVSTKKTKKKSKKKVQKQKAINLLDFQMNRDVQIEKDVIKFMMKAKAQNISQIKMMPVIANQPVLDEEGEEHEEEEIIKLDDASYFVQSSQDVAPPVILKYQQSKLTPYENNDLESNIQYISGHPKNIQDQFDQPNEIQETKLDDYQEQYLIHMKLQMDLSATLKQHFDKFRNPEASVQKSAEEISKTILSKAPDAFDMLLASSNVQNTEEEKVPESKWQKLFAPEKWVLKEQQPIVDDDWFIDDFKNKKSTEIAQPELKQEKVKEKDTSRNEISKYEDEHENWEDA